MEQVIVRRMGRTAMADPHQDLRRSFRVYLERAVMAAPARPTTNRALLRTLVLFALLGTSRRSNMKLWNAWGWGRT